MKISYMPLWIKLKRNYLSKTDLRKNTGMTTYVLAKMGRDEPVNLDILVRICEYLDCGLEDVVTLEREEGEKDYLSK